jgi:multidrug efflux pump
MAIVGQAVRFPITVVVLTVRCSAAVPYAYSMYGKGVEFFPSVEPDYGLLYVHARGNLSLDEMDAATREAEPHARLAGHQVGLYPRRQDARRRRRDSGRRRRRHPVRVHRLARAQAGHDILDDLRVAMAGIPGVDVEVRVPDAGPPTGQAIQVQLSATDPTGLNEKAREVAAAVAKVPGVIDISDGLPPPGIDWALEVDRSKAAQYGVSARCRSARWCSSSTTGLKLTDYRPAGADDAVDIRLRLPEDRRTLSALDELRVETAQGSVPISNFVTRRPEPTVGILNRIDGKRTITMQANVASGYQVR